MSLLVRWWYKLNNQPVPEQHGHAGPSLVEKSRKLIKRRMMMRAVLMARQ